MKGEMAKYTKVKRKKNIPLKNQRYPGINK